jgi:hypothetical protein
MPEDAAALADLARVDPDIVRLVAGCQLPVASDAG